jgi:hypothetical protein
MANTPVQRAVTEINPMFSIPDGVDELKYAEIAEDAELRAADDYTGTVETVVFTDMDTDLPPEEIYIDTPDIVGVISQVLRRSAGGNNVVDIIVEVDGDGAGISKYEFRVTKA